MRRTPNSFLLFSSVLAFGLSISSVSQYWDYDHVLQDLSLSLQHSVSSDQIENEIKRAIVNQNFDDARMYLDIAHSHHYSIDFQKYLSEIRYQDTNFKRISAHVTNFSEGFIKGKSDNLAGVAGSVSADFTVIGDARDLYKEYGKYERGEDVNELIVTLSGVGLGLTALTVGSLGSMTPVKAGASVMKVAAKAQKLTVRFQKTLLKLGHNVFDWPVFTRMVKQRNSISNVRRSVKAAYKPEAIGPLKVVAGNVNNIRKSSSTVDAIQMLKYVETTDDLRHLEKVTLKYGTKTKGMMKLLGKGAIRTVRVLRKSTELMLSLVGGLLSSLASLFFMMLYRRP